MMSHAEGPLQPGDRAPNVLLDMITYPGQVSIDEFRGDKPLLIGLFRGLHCPFCRRHIAAQAEIDRALRDQGVECLTVVNTPADRARLYLRYHPVPDLIAAADPERASHRAFGLPNLEFTENETKWPYKVGMDVLTEARLKLSDVNEPVNAMEAAELLNPRDGYEITEADERMIATGRGQLFGQFLIDREGIVRWSFTEVPGGGERVFAKADPRELMSAASEILH
jgi:peroxiredoxin